MSVDTFLYQLLGVSKDADAKAIKKGYKTQTFRYHPDRTKKGHRRVQAINEAYETLQDPDKRAQYDAEGYLAIFQRERIPTLPELDEEDARENRKEGQESSDQTGTPSAGVIDLTKFAKTRDDDKDKDKDKDKDEDEDEDDDDDVLDPEIDELLTWWSDPAIEKLRLQQRFMLDPDSNAEDIIDAFLRFARLTHPATVNRNDPRVEPAQRALLKSAKEAKINKGYINAVENWTGEGPLIFDPFQDGSFVDEQGNKLKHKPSLKHPQQTPEAVFKTYVDYYHIFLQFLGDSETALKYLQDRVNPKLKKLWEAEEMKLQGRGGASPDVNTALLDYFKSKKESIDWQHLMELLYRAKKGIWENKHNSTDQGRTKGYQDFHLAMNEYDIFARKADFPPMYRNAFEAQSKSVAGQTEEPALPKTHPKAQRPEHSRKDDGDKAGGNSGAQPEASRADVRDSSAPGESSARRTATRSKSPASSVPSRRRAGPEAKAQSTSKPTATPSSGKRQFGASTKGQPFQVPDPKDNKMRTVFAYRVHGTFRGANSYQLLLQMTSGNAPIQIYEMIAASKYKGDFRHYMKHGGLDMGSFRGVRKDLQERDLYDFEWKGIATQRRDPTKEPIAGYARYGTTMIIGTWNGDGNKLVWYSRSDMIREYGEGSIDGRIQAAFDDAKVKKPAKPKRNYYAYKWAKSQGRGRGKGESDDEDAETITSADSDIHSRSDQDDEHTEDDESEEEEEDEEDRQFTQRHPDDNEELDDDEAEKLARRREELERELKNVDKQQRQHRQRQEKEARKSREKSTFEAFDRDERARQKGRRSTKTKSRRPPPPTVESDKD